MCGQPGPLAAEHTGKVADLASLSSLRLALTAAFPSGNAQGNLADPANMWLVPPLLQPSVAHSQTRQSCVALPTTTPKTVPALSATGCQPPYAPLLPTDIDVSSWVRLWVIPPPQPAQVGRAVPLRNARPPRLAPLPVPLAAPLSTPVPHNLRRRSVHPARYPEMASLSPSPSRHAGAGTTPGRRGSPHLLLGTNAPIRPPATTALAPRYLHRRGRLGRRPVAAPRALHKLRATPLPQCRIRCQRTTHANTARPCGAVTAAAAAATAALRP